MLYKELEIGNKTYKCVLSTSASVQAEKKLGANPLTVLLDMSDGTKLPSIESLVTILWASLQKYNHGITFEDTFDLFDQYVEDGHQLTDIIPDILDIFEVSGYFKRKDEKESKNSKKANEK